ncbi:hypothetical protein M8818_003223 [Zalaria obscura]|uniref:Uncharacterized protein n=1 Tax=Zalaria obscura TaxID=2024903 RepID=A0ACC3SFC7_9PEZI
MPTTGYPHTHCFIEGALIFNDDHICLTPRWKQPDILRQFNTSADLQRFWNRETLGDNIHALVERYTGINASELLADETLNRVHETRPGEKLGLMFKIYDIKDSQSQSPSGQGPIYWWVTKEECLQNMAHGPAWLLDIIKELSASDSRAIEMRPALGPFRFWNTSADRAGSGHLS